MYGVSHEGKYYTFNKILVRKAQISVESYLNYQSVSQKSILCDVYFIALRIIGSYIRIWERPGDLPSVIEILFLFASGAQRNERKETNISITSGRSPGLSQQRM
jgi:hypothetical protein